MKAFWALLKVYFKSLLLTSLNLGRGNKKKAASGIAAMVLLGVIFLFLSTTYSFMMAALFGPLGGLDIMLMIMILMAVGFSLIFTIFAAQSMVFSTKDVDMVMAMPVSSFFIMLARVSALYLEVLLMVEFLLLPAGVCYLIFGGSGGARFLLLLLLLGAFLAFLPTLLSLIVGALVSFLVARLPFKNFFIALFSIGLTMLIMVGSMSITSGMQAVAADIEGVRAAIVSAIPPLGWVVQAVTGPNILLFLLIAAACILPFLAITWVFSLFFKWALTALASHTSKNNYRLRSVSASGSFAALFKKEASKFLRTPGFLLNSGIGVVIIIAASVFAAFNRNTIFQMFARLLEVDPSASLQSYLPIILMGAMFFFLTTIYTAAVSISLEGKTLWILKEAPLSTTRIFAAKIGLNFVLAGGSALIATPLLGYAFGFTLVDTIACTLMALLFSFLISTTGLLSNLLAPRMDAENEMVIIKQSMSFLIAMLLELVYLCLIVGLFFLTQSLGFLVFAGLATLLLIVLNAAMLLILNTKGRRLFAAL